MSQLADAETAIEGLYPSAPQQLPFDPTVDIRSFLLLRDHGNLLLYSVAAPNLDLEGSRGSATSRGST